MKDNEEILEEVINATSRGEEEKALTLLEPLVEKEVPGALGLLGLMYHLGSGLECDGIKAVKYLTWAYELGDGTAAHNLGTLYCMGAPGVERDHEKGRYFYRKAKEMGAQYAPDDFYEFK